MTDQTFSIDDDLDLDDAGLQPTDAEFTITDVEITSNDRGQRWVVHFEPSDGLEIEGLMGNKVRDSGYLTHTDREDLVNIGRSSLKRLRVAATGTASGPMTEMIGSRVQARVSEDANGFARIGRYKSA